MLGYRIHFDGHVGIKAEVPEAAAFLGKGRGNGRIIEIQNRVIGISCVVFVDGFDQRSGNAGSVALGNKTDTLVNGIFELHQRFFGTDFVVERDDFKLFTAQHTAIGVNHICHVLEMLVAGITDIAKRTG